MGRMLGGYLLPHPPIIVEEIGRGQEIEAQKTINGAKKIAKDIRNKKPTTIIVITPHGPLFRDAISISVEENLEGSFANFGRGDLKFQFENNIQLVKNILVEAGKEGITLAPVDEQFAKEYRISLNIDHGTLVPLYFINNEYTDYKLVHITYGLFSPTKLYKFGTILQKVLLESKEDGILIASGDLSHKLSDDGPYVYSPQGPIFDEKIVNLLKKGDFQGIANFDLELAEEAGECGLRSLMILAGFLDGYSVETDVLSYEGPFGVGYCTSKIDIVEKQKDRKFLNSIIKKEKDKITKKRENEDEYVSLARKSLEYYIREGETLEVPQNISEKLLNTKAGVFVTIKKDNMLRGCIGTIGPVEDCVALEIIKNAISAGTRDPRFSSVKEEELGKLVYSVDVLGTPQKINSFEELDVKQYGVIVSKGYRRGLLLPNLDGIDTVEEQVSIALKKAGIYENEDYTLERFQVVRHF